MRHVRTTRLGTRITLRGTETGKHSVGLLIAHPSATVEGRLNVHFRSVSASTGTTSLARGEGGKKATLGESVSAYIEDETDQRGCSTIPSTSKSVVLLLLRAQNKFERWINSTELEDGDPRGEQVTCSRGGSHEWKVSYRDRRRTLSSPYHASCQGQASNYKATRGPIPRKRRKADRAA